MAAPTLSNRAAAQPVTPSLPVYPLSVDQYHQMIRAGVINDDDPVELLEGILVFKMGKNPPHTVCTQKLVKYFATRLSSGYHFRAQEPVTLDDGEPEPDGAIARGEISDFGQRHPSPAELPLIIEVSDSTLTRDRGIKLRSYARAGIANYWIINLDARHVEVYANPDPLGLAGYVDRRDYLPNETIELSLDSGDPLWVTVAEVLP